MIKNLPHFSSHWSFFKLQPLKKVNQTLKIFPKNHISSLAFKSYMPG